MFRNIIIGTMLFLSSCFSAPAFATNGQGGGGIGPYLAQACETPEIVSDSLLGHPEYGVTSLAWDASDPEGVMNFKSYLALIYNVTPDHISDFDRFQVYLLDQNNPDFSGQVWVVMYHDGCFLDAGFMTMTDYNTFFGPVE